MYANDCSTYVRMPRGQYTGKRLADIPDQYLHWALATWYNLEPRLRAAIEKRLGLRSESQLAGDDLESIIDRWYDAMTSRHEHGYESARELAVVQDGYDLLMKLLKGEPEPEEEVKVYSPACSHRQHSPEPSDLQDSKPRRQYAYRGRSPKPWVGENI